MRRIENNENDYNRLNTENVEDFSAPFSGYLMKKSSAGDWQRRYFEINGKYLIYYRNHTMSKLLAAVSIPQLGDIKLQGEISDGKGNGYVIQIDLKEKQYFLRAETIDDAQKWITHLLFVRDGEILKSELRSALSNSPTGSVRIKTVTFTDSPTFNPQHDSDPSGKSHFLSISSEDPDLKESGKIPPSILINRAIPKRRISDANWQKSHRSFFSCCFRS